MQPQEIQETVDRAARAELWSEVCAALESLFLEIDESVRADDGKLLDENIGYLLDYIHKFSSKDDMALHALLAAQVFGAIPHGQAVERGLALAYEIAPSATANAFVSGLFGIADRITEAGVGVRAGPFGEALTGLAEKRSDFGPMVGRFSSVAAHGLDITVSRTTDDLVASYITHSRPPGRGPVTANPGDVIFRDLQAPYRWGIRWLKLPQFGHCAIYLGPDPARGEDQKTDDHHVIEMEGWLGPDNLPINCVVHTVGEFKAHGGYWGLYSANLDFDQRKSVLCEALSLQGKCLYGVTGNAYKNPAGNQFRCDGLVEHCYEKMISLPPVLSHRRGLFEDDTWNTLSPNALRSCLFEFVAGF